MAPLVLLLAKATAQLQITLEQRDEAEQIPTLHLPFEGADLALLYPSFVDDHLLLRYRDFAA